MKKEITENSKNQRFIKEGRGQGELENYIPWTKISDFPSQGRATRIHGLKTNRIHHLHSDNQLRAFLLFEWSDRVIDIRESFPLIDIMEVIDKKNDLRLDKFSEKETGKQYVLTTNFLLTVKDSEGNIGNVARSIKNASDLKKKIVIEKLEIERRYWLEKGIDWKVITNREQNKQFCKNIEWVRDTLIGKTNDSLEMDAKGNELSLFIIKNNNRKMKDVLNEYENVNKLEKGRGLYLFRYLIGKKKIEVDMRNRIDLNKNYDALTIRFSSK